MNASTYGNCPVAAHNCLIDCIRLIRTPKIGPIAFQRLVKLYKTPKLALDALRCGEFGHSGYVYSESEAQREIDLCCRLGARMVSMFEQEYPQMLLNIYDPPPVITVLGNMKLLSASNKIAVVGSRDASANGKRIAHRMARDLSGAGLVTVSGLARGIDSAVHSVALDGIPTVAVIASGVDIVYPKDNLYLYQAIARNGGAVVTELPFSSLPKASFFPQRNRIISGMAWGTVVIEASRRSGSLITAKFALSQGREVFSVPGSALDPRYSGSNFLIKQGATLVESAEDVTQVLSLGACPISTKNPQRNSQKNCTTESTNTTTTRSVILGHLSISPTDIEDLAACTKISISALLAELIGLELLGKVHRFPGNKFALALEN
ncbi:DNA-processing protein DprA [Anaplasma capra]|nr:DNA-processing protein DprA [Anaplasma capra]